MMLKINKTIFILVSIFTIALEFSLNNTANAEFYKVNLTRIEQDFYKDTNSGYYFRTRFCYEYVYYEDAIYNSDENTLTFRNNSSYDLEGIYKKIK